MRRATTPLDISQPRDAPSANTSMSLLTFSNLLPASAYSSIPKLPEPQTGTAKRPCAGTGIIFKREEAGYTLPSVTTHLQTATNLKSKWDCKAAPELAFLWQRPGFFPSHAMYRQRPLPAIPMPVISFSGKRWPNCTNLLASVITHPCHAWCFQIFKPAIYAYAQIFTGNEVLPLLFL